MGRRLPCRSVVARTVTVACSAGARAAMTRNSKARAGRVRPAARIILLLLGRSRRGGRGLRGGRAGLRAGSRGRGSLLGGRRRRGGLGEDHDRRLDAVEQREILIEVRLAFLGDALLRGT